MSESRRKIILDAAREIIQLEGERARLNREMSELRKGVRKEGISIEAFNLALAQYKLDEHKRYMQQREYVQCCEALGIAVQLKLDLGDDGDAQVTHSDLAERAQAPISDNDCPDIAAAGKHISVDYYVQKLSAPVVDGVLSEVYDQCLADSDEGELEDWPLYWQAVAVKLTDLVAKQSGLDVGTVMAKAQEHAENEPASVFTDDADPDEGADNDLDGFDIDDDGEDEGADLETFAEQSGIEHVQRH